MKEWKPKSFDDINDTLRNYDLYLNFIDMLKTAKQIQPEIIIVEQYIFEEIERIIKNEFIDEFIKARKKLGIENIIIKRENKDFSYYQIYYNSMDRNIYVEPYYKIENKEEINDMLKILEIYKDKKEKEIEIKYDAEITELENNDPVRILIKETEEKLKVLLNLDMLTITTDSNVRELTQETTEKIREIIRTINNEKQKLKVQISEIESLLELAPNYEEKMQILRDYGIIDKKKNIIL